MNITRKYHKNLRVNTIEDEEKSARLDNGKNSQNRLWELREEKLGKPGFDNGKRCESGKWEQLEKIHSQKPVRPEIFSWLDRHDD